MEQASESSEISVANTGVALPQDVVDEILLRVPARQLRRFRAVCRSWCSLLSDPSFVKEHAALCSALIIALTADASRIDVADLSGSVVKQIHVPAVEEEAVLPAHPGRCFLFRANKRVRMVDPDTGAVFTLPFDDLDNPTPQRSYWSTTGADYVLGRDSSTGHHKVLRIVTRVICRRFFKQLYHVFTLGGAADDNQQQQQQWRQCPGPQFSVKSKVDFPGVTIQGLVYYMAGHFFSTLDIISHNYDASIDKNMKFVVSFDLEKEQWRTFQVPMEVYTGSATFSVDLAKLRNTLVMVHCRLHRSNIDLWFSQDLERGIWVKKHCIDTELLAPSPHTSPKSFTPMELDDGRIIFSYYMAWTQEGPHWQTRVYDPRTKACTDLPQLDLCAIVAVYKESLLYLVKW